VKILDTDGVIQIIILIILLALSGYFSSSETALTTVNRFRLKELAEQGNKGAINSLKLLENPSKMLSTILICNNVVNLSASALTTTMAARIWGNTAIAISTGLLTFLMLIFGEITPKTMATLNNEKVSLRCGSVIYGISKIITPVIYLVDKFSNAVLRLFRIDPKSARKAVSEYEFRSFVETSVQDGVIETEEKEIINNVVDFGDTTAKDIMIPKVDITFVPIDSTFDELKDIFLEEKYTRLPVYEDTTDNVVGIVNMKDLLFYENWDGFSIGQIMREPAFTYEYKNTADLLAEMRQKSISMIIVLDEYGAAVGLITLEDLLEEIVGDIRDEYDDYEKDSIIEVEPRKYLIDGSKKLDDINDFLGTDFESEDFDSIGGLIIEKLDDFPKEGDSVVLDNKTVLTVVDMDKNHIDKIEMLLPEDTPESESDIEDADDDID